MHPPIIVGLGNPGEKYKNTRHNLGFMVCDMMNDRYGDRWSFPRESYAKSEIKSGGKIVWLIKPMTYMNLSGEALEDLLGDGDIDPQQILVICDDIALPLGELRIRRKGSDGGHNGLWSIGSSLGTMSFPRLRMGVGEPPTHIEGADFVTAPFLEEEHEAAGKMVRGGVKCAQTWVRDGINTAMQRFNAKKKKPKPEETPKPDPDGSGGEESV